eukprot:CAMPEP_0170543474 /NCGR_PEP_ID=MMETSP0211-20121228/2571_1 /TAXON_ID=311385 /ORGANISM="Pseudokeronopsis sp., Strain OXSARD2" /LENGTH=130 /DNA_ID=CAMNT_0010846857 /DNA_START=1308 /DNA_END=1700 /DNA_ORIENTATION=-
MNEIRKIKEENEELRNIILKKTKKPKKDKRPKQISPTYNDKNSSTYAPSTSKKDTSFLSQNQSVLSSQPRPEKNHFKSGSHLNQTMSSNHNHISKCPDCQYWQNQILKYESKIQKHIFDGIQKQQYMVNN